jgi:hypothetical protein
VAAWMVVDQYVLGHLDAHVEDYVRRPAPSSRSPTDQGLGRQRALVTHAVIAGLIAVMAVVVAGVGRCAASQLLLAWCRRCCRCSSSSTYAGWLWFFGHNLHPWGAFTVKPFMPTVFGEGKVAQFSTYSYPYWGYALLLLVFAC